LINLNLNRALWLAVLLFPLVSGISFCDAESPNVTSCLSNDDPQQEMTCEEQEHFISDMISKIDSINTMFLKVNKLRDEPLITRQEHRIKIRSKMDELFSKIKSVSKGDKLTDPACKSKLIEEITPALTKIETRYRVVVLELVSIKVEELAKIRDELKSFYEKKDYTTCINKYRNARSRIGEFFFKYAAPLDKKYNLVVNQMAALHDKAQKERALLSGKKGPSLPDSEGNREPEGTIIAYKVKVRTKGGAKYEAVVKDRKLVSRFEDNATLDLNALPAKSIISFFYMYGMSGSTSVQVRELISVTATAPLDIKGLSGMSGAVKSRISKSEQKEKARISALKKRNAQKRKEIEDAALRKKKLEKEAADNKKEEIRFALLRRFPPEKGWGKAKKKELERRSVVLGVYPNKDEQEFLDKYEEWTKLNKAWQAKQKKAGKK